MSRELTFFEKSCYNRSEVNYEEIFYLLASGFTIVFVKNSKKAICLETRATIDRGVNESTSEPIIRGPKDSFTENYNKNLGLIKS